MRVQLKLPIASLIDAIAADTQTSNVNDAGETTGRQREHKTHF